MLLLLFLLFELLLFPHAYNNIVVQLYVQFFFLNKFFTLFILIFYPYRVFVYNNTISIPFPHIWIDICNTQIKHLNIYTCIYSPSKDFRRDFPKLFWVCQGLGFLWSIVFWGVFSSDMSGAIFIKWSVSIILPYIEGGSNIAFFGNLKTASALCM